MRRCARGCASTCRPSSRLKCPSSTAVRDGCNVESVFIERALTTDVRHRAPPATTGSVSMDNCEPIAALPDVDGFLVGGAATRLVYAGHHPAGIKVRRTQNDEQRRNAAAHPQLVSRSLFSPDLAERVCRDCVPRGRVAPRRGVRRRRCAMCAGRGAAKQAAPGGGASGGSSARGLTSDVTDNLAGQP
jgi:hypothetical protein